MTIITGAGAGIGRACALAAAKRDWRVVAVDVDAERAEATVAAIHKRGGRSTAVCADVSVSGQVDRMIATVVDSFGRIDVLINNAAIFRTSPVVDTTDETWAETLAVNLNGAFYCSRAAARRMIEQGGGGRIVSLTSMHAGVSEPAGGAYTATKAGVEGFSRTLASEVAPHGITVNCVRPGATWTRLTEPIYSPDVIRALEARIPLGKIAQPEWIAEAVLFLASPAARYITGATLTVDGGYSMDGSLPGLVYTHDSTAA